MIGAQERPLVLYVGAEHDLRLIEPNEPGQVPLVFVICGHRAWGIGTCRGCVLDIVDGKMRELPVATPGMSVSGRSAARELTAILERRGKPVRIVSDHGTEFTSNAILASSKDAR